MSFTTNTKFRVAICGGGLGGLTAAIALGKNKDMLIDIYESAHEFSEIGTAIGMYLRPWRVMQELGLEDKIKSLAAVVPNPDIDMLSFSMRKSDQVAGIPFWDAYIPNGTLLVRRSALQNVLVEQLDLDIVTVYFKKRLASYSQPDKESSKPIVLRFNDGETATCDVLIGADGIHSVTRQQMMREYADELKESSFNFLDNVNPVWTGTYAYRAMIPVKKLAEVNPNHTSLTTPTIYMGRQKHIVAFPVSNDKMINVVAFVSDPDKEWTPLEGEMVEEKSHDDIVRTYEGWEPEIIQLMQCIDKPMKWAICEVKGLPKSVRGAVALLGDAAHAMTPHLGSGAGQAVEDAYILAAVLSHPLTTTQNLHEALEVYETIRLPFARGVQNKSRMNGKIMELTDQRFRDLATDKFDDVALNNVKESMYEVWNWAWTTSPEDDRKDAMQLLEEKLSK